MNPISRAINIIVRPNLEWSTIAVEPSTPAAIFVGYVLPLAAIGPICTFVGLTLVGVGMPFLGSLHYGFAYALIVSIMAYVFSVLGVVALAAIVNLLAPSFGGRRNFTQALKAVAYAFTPTFLIGVVGLFPLLGIVALLGGLYSIVLLFIGLPIVMGTTKDRAPLYTLAVMGCGLVIGLVFGGINMGVSFAALALTGGFNGIASGIAASNREADAGAAAAAIGSVMGASASNQQALKDAVNAAASAVPADGADPSASQDPAAQAAAGVNVLKALVGGNKNVAVVPREQLASLLPATLGDMTRGNADSETNAVAGVKGSKASADYKDAAGTISIDVTDLGNASGLAALTDTAANMVESDNDEGFEKNVVLGGTKVHETWKISTKHSEILGIVNSRFAITATGDGVDMPATERAFQTIDLGKLNDMAASAK